MEIDITATLSKEINFAPQSKYEEILQNVRTILTTALFSVPLYRNFGINFDMLDEPIPIAQYKLTAKIITAVEKYEPRAKVTKVKYSGDGLDGVLKPTVSIIIRE